MDSEYPFSRFSSFHSLSEIRLFSFYLPIAGMTFPPQVVSITLDNCQIPESVLRSLFYSPTAPPLQHLSLRRSEVICPPPSQSSLLRPRWWNPRAPRLSELRSLDLRDMIEDQMVYSHLLTSGCLTCLKLSDETFEEQFLPEDLSERLTKLTALRVLRIENARLHPEQVRASSSSSFSLYCSSSTRICIHFPSRTYVCSFRARVPLCLLFWSCLVHVHLLYMYALV